MDRDRLSRIEALFERALSLGAGERAAFLDRECGDDPALRREVESLLAADGEASGFLAEPAAASPDALPPEPPAPERAQQRLGPYLLLRRIGEGGMSEVWLAVRSDDAYRKQVAVKIIRHDRDRNDVLQRFRTERQILAALDHPNIARLIDAGTTEDGLPYFVMDYIDGMPLDRYCDEKRLGLRQRLELFRTVCTAVQYAHRNLIVHRDIKSSNVLVGADGVPKLLDFGIAKLLRPELLELQGVERTQTWLRPMTPRYASPEQVRGRPITTASDVYSLGVLLYKLLTGHLPYRTDAGPATDVVRQVVEDEPDRPSTSISRVEPDPTTPDTELTPVLVSQARDTLPTQLRRQLRGDLDNIVLMALRKEPERRYASVDQFSDDIRRYLAGLPVHARQDTLGYRTAKFLRRNWIGTGVAAAFVVLLVAFAVTMAVQASRIARQRDEARRERDRAERIQGFTQEIFGASDPFLNPDVDMKARELLDRGAERIETELEGDPLVQAALMETIGTAYESLGLYDKARPLLEKSLELRRAQLGSDHIEVATSLFHLGTLLTGMEVLPEAEVLLKEAIKIREHRLGVDHSLLGRPLCSLATVYHRSGNYDAAESTYERAMSVLPEGSPDLARAKEGIGALLFELGRHTEAEGAFREALQINRSTLRTAHPLVAYDLGALGTALGVQGKYDEAEPLLREAVQMYRDTLGEVHPALGSTVGRLAKLLHVKGESEEAKKLYQEAIEIQRKATGEGHPDLAYLATSLGDLLVDTGEYEKAEEMHRLALEIQRRVYGPRHAEVGRTLVGLGDASMKAGNPASAEPLLREGLEILSATLPADHWRTAEARSLLGECLGALKRGTEAEPLLVEGLRQLEATRGASSPPATAARARLAQFYSAANRPEEAARLDPVSAQGNTGP